MICENKIGRLATPLFTERGDEAEHVKYEILASVQSEKGRSREVNEDSGSHVNPSDPELLASKGTLTIIADGIGGHASGEVASRMAVEIVNRIFYEKENESEDALVVAFREANRQIYAAAQLDEKLHGMATTCTALVLRNGMAFAAHVGQCRLYLVRDREIYLMTEDHSMAMKMAQHGIITLKEARHHAKRKVILRSLGTGREVEVATWLCGLHIREGDQFIVCSDGLHAIVEDEEIKRVIVSASDPQNACEELIAKALEFGGYDDIAVGVVGVRRA